MPAAGRQAIPCLFTFAALGAGVGSILASGQGQFLLAAELILVSLLLDGLDGAVARMLKAQTPFGAELDTFVDVTSFGLAPAALLYFHPHGLRLLPGWGAALACLYVFSGAARLSRFRAGDPYRGARGYLGLPITVAAGFMASYLVAVERAVGQNGPFALAAGPLAIGFWTALALMLALQVSRIRYAKPTKNPWALVPFAACLVLLFFPTTALYSAAFMFAYGLWFAFVSPFFFRRFLDRFPPVEAAPAAPDGGGTPKE